MVYWRGVNWRCPGFSYIPLQTSLILRIFHIHVCRFTDLSLSILILKFFKKITINLYVQKVIRSDVIRSVILYVRTLYVRSRYTFRFIRSDVIRSDVIRSVFIRSDVIRSDVIRSVIIRSVGESILGQPWKWGEHGIKVCGSSVELPENIKSKIQTTSHA